MRTATSGGAGERPWHNGNLDQTETHSGGERGTLTERVRPSVVPRWRRVLPWVATMVVGPGLLVMLADTDAGSVVTAAQSGARFRFAMVLPELALIPVLYVVQEMTVRIGLATQLGHGALIRREYGRVWASVAALTLLAACTGAMVTELAGVAGVGSLVGFPTAPTVGAAALGLIAVLLLGRYRRVEAIGIVVGALELLFVVAALSVHPSASRLLASLGGHWSLAHGYGTLLAANVGAVVMPWMIYYQQEAVIDKGYGADPAGVRRARRNTALGAVATQVVMVAIVVALGATIGSRDPGHSLGSIGAIAAALTPFLGHRGAIVLFGLGMVGASVTAALVVSVAGAWGIAEVLGWRHSLNDEPRAAVGFYAIAVGGIVASALAVMASVNLVALSVDVEVMNAVLLPVVLGFLVLLERRLEPAHRMGGPRRVLTYALTALVVGVGLVTAVGVVGRVA